MAQGNSQVKVIKECLIKYFVFYYNSVYKVYKDAKYGIGQQPQEPELDHAKAIQELDNKQDRIYYRIDIYGNIISLKLVMHSIEKVDEDVSDKKIF